MIHHDTTTSPHQPREPDAPQRKHERLRRSPRPSGGGVGHYAAFTLAPAIELEVHVVGATAIGTDGRAAGGSRWDVSGWQLIERVRGTTRVLAGQRGNFSAMWIAIELARRSTSPAQLVTSLSAAGIPRLTEDRDV